MCQTARVNAEHAALASLLLMLTGAAAAQPASSPADDPRQFLREPPKPASVRGKFSVASVGDLLLARPQSQTADPQMQRVLTLLRSADVAIANQEGMAFDLKTYRGWAYGDGQVWSYPSMARDYRAMGIGMVSVANNHSMDWGPAGLFDSMALLDAAGVAHAGGGKTLEEARSAGFFDTPKGRVGLVATASTFKINARADDAFGDTPSRPGISTLRTQSVNLVTSEQMTAIKRLATEFASPLKPAPSADARQLTFGGETYRVAERPGMHYEMDLYDHAGLLKAVREAKEQSDLVVFHIHAHESPTGVDDDTPEPPDFLIQLFHDAVDAGADVVMGGGPHSLRGIEIYKGKPVLYGLGLFYFKPIIKALEETALRRYADEGYAPEPDPRPHNPDIWYDSVLVISDFDGARLERVRLYPIDLKNTDPPGSRGLPHLAAPEKARQILETLRRDSSQFGTRIAVQGSMGVITVPPTAIAADTAPVMKVLISPGPMDQSINHGELKVKVTVPGFDAAPGTPLFNLPAYPELVVTDSKGRVPVTADTDDSGHWKASRAVSGELVIRYRVPVENTPTNGGIPPLGPRIDGKGFSGAGQTFLAIPQSNGPYRILIAWDLAAMGQGATASSSFGDGDVELPPGAPSRLERAAFMAGRLNREPAIVTSNGFSAVWSGDPGFDPRPLMQWTGRLHAWMGKFFQTDGDPPYRVFLRYNPANAGGGVAFPNSFVVTYGEGVTAESLKQILPHEMTHTWTSNDLGKWYDEGDAVYYQALLPWRAGMISTEAYLDDLNKTAARYYTNPELSTPEEKIIPKFWSDVWLNTLGYDRGALYFAVLDGKIRRASDNRRSVDDLVRRMIQKARAGETITEDTWIELVRQEIGEDGVSAHQSMMRGGLVVPESDDYGPCFGRVTRQIRRFELGFRPKPLADGRKQVQALIEDSEAAKAGLKNDDVVSYRTITTEGVRRDPTATITATVTRGGETFPVTFLPRGKAVDAFQWQRNSDVPDAACRR